MTPQTPAPSGGQPAGGQGQAPFGQTGGATTAVPNRGYEAAAMQSVAVILQQLEKLIPMLGSTSPNGKIVVDCVQKLSKLAPPGSASPAGTKNHVEGLALQNAQQSQQMAALRQQGAAGAAGAQQPKPGMAA
jgi:hypothetical protein